MRRCTRLVSPRVDALAQIDGWPAPHAAVAVVSRDGAGAQRGEAGRSYRWASITKLLTTLAALVAGEEGTIDLDEPAGPEGSTVRHLLAHASGLAFDAAQSLSRPGRRRIYSNTGFEVLADAIARAAGMPFERYFRSAVVEPLALRGDLRGSAASGFHGDLRDLIALARELLAPTLVAPETLAEATTVAFPGLGGILPGLGRMNPNDWALGFELRDGKAPHWTGSLNSPKTFGHFGGSGTFLWIDPERALALACLTDLEFGDWAKEAWPRLSDAVLEEVG